MLCNKTPTVSLMIFYRQAKSFEQPGYVFWSTAQELPLSCYPNINFNNLLILTPSTAQDSSYA